MAPEPTPLGRALKFGRFIAALAVLRNKGLIDEAAAKASLKAGGGSGRALRAHLGSPHGQAARAGEAAGKNPFHPGRHDVMSNYAATVVWTRAPDAPFKDNKYSRAHEWRFDGGAVVKGSSAPSSVRVPLSDPTAVDPEEALVASLSAVPHAVFPVVRRAGWSRHRSLRR